jgi:hypothetical protein
MSYLWVGGLGSQPRALLDGAHVPMSPCIQRGLGFTSCSVHSAQSQINTMSDLIPHANLQGNVNMVARNAA